MVANSRHELSITIFANIDLSHFSRPEVVAFEEEGEVMKRLDVFGFDKACDEGKLDGGSELSGHHCAIAIDVEIDHGMSVVGIDWCRALDSNDGITLLDVDAQEAIGCVIA